MERLNRIPHWVQLVGFVVVMLVLGSVPPRPLYAVVMVLVILVVTMPPRGRRRDR